MLERLGIADELAERRERLVSGLSPEGRHRVFPTVYAKPMPGDALSEARAALKLAHIENDALQVSVSRLRKERDALLAKIEALNNPNRRAVTFNKVSIVDLQIFFCEVYNEFASAEGERRITVDDLCSEERTREISWPRMACLSLARTLCGLSYPSIARAFGGRDHTSVINAIRRTAYVLNEMPHLAKAHAHVLTVMQPVP